MGDAEELAKIIREIRDIVKILYRVQPPSLPRPKVPFGAPPTAELVQWAARVYAYSLLCQFREVLDSTLFLYDSGHVPAVFLCCRSVFEMAAHAYYVKKHSTDHLNKHDYNEGWDFMLRVPFGTLRARRRSPAARCAGLKTAAT